MLRDVVQVWIVIYLNYCYTIIPNFEKLFLLEQYTVKILIPVKDSPTNVYEIPKKLFPQYISYIQYNNFYSAVYDRLGLASTKAKQKFKFFSQFGRFY